MEERERLTIITPDRIYNRMFFRKKKIDKTKESKIILAMIMLSDDHSFDVDMFSKDFKSHNTGKIQEPTGDNVSFVFYFDGEMVAIAYIPVPIPSGDIEGAAQYDYNWTTRSEERR